MPMLQPFNTNKIAIIHDHLAQAGGAEEVVKVLKSIFIQAPIFTLIYNKKNTIDFFRDQNIQTSFLQKIPFGVSRYQWWIALMPLAVENYNVMDYDIILSSSSSFAKGVITRPDSLHICYCYTPTRFLWTDTYSYIQELRVNPLVKKILPLSLRKLRQWDRLAADRVDYFVAVSETVKKRIKKYYNRDSVIVYPPVDVESFYISDKPKNYYLAGGRLVPYKKIDLAVKAFSRLGIPLKIFGVGPEMAKLKKIAKSNIEFLGRVSESQKRELFANCVAYLNPQEEDFGITAVEAMAAGRPVIAFKRGGALETIKDGETGEFFDEQIWEELADKIIRFDHNRFEPQFIRQHAMNFNVDNFKIKITQLVLDLIKNKHNL